MDISLTADGSEPEVVDWIYVAAGKPALGR